MTEKPRNARFWVYVNGAFAKLTLREDDVAYWTRFEWTDEGSQRTSMWWTHKGDFVERETVVNARDCDGRLDRHSVQTCALGDLAALGLEDCDAPLPRWRDLRASQRDHAAEAMGY